MHEEALRRAGHQGIAGVDDAGRGPLAGPVVAAAVIFQSPEAPGCLDDSKKLSGVKREKLFEMLIAARNVRIGVGMAGVEEIDTLNILRATERAMQRAVAALDPSPDHLLVDGLPVRGLTIRSTAVVGGDGQSLSIAAASVVAKVTRDRIMIELDARYPEYGFARHKGYGTREHLEALRVHGPCPWHRRSFAPVSQRTLPF